MNYFIIDNSPTVNREFCMLEDGPRAISRFAFRLLLGKPMGSDYPRDVVWRMSDRYGGIKLPSLIGNTANMLVVERRLKEVFEQAGVPIECLPFTLLNHKGRVASLEYFIINPLGTFDCLHQQQSEIERAEGEVVGVDKYVLDTAKLKDAPDLFRISETPEEIVISHRLADKLKKLNPTNVYLIDLEQATSSEP